MSGCSPWLLLWQDIGVFAIGISPGCIVLELPSPKAGLTLFGGLPGPMLFGVHCLIRAMYEIVQREWSLAPAAADGSGCRDLAILCERVHVALPSLDELG